MPFFFPDFFFSIDATAEIARNTEENKNDDKDFSRKRVIKQSKQTNPNPTQQHQSVIIWSLQVIIPSPVTVLSDTLR